MINNVTDPVVYPVTFELDRRNFTLIDNRYATVTFATENWELKQGVYFNDGNYISDIDLSDESIAFIKNGKKSTFEFLASSQELSTSTFSLKIWKDEKSFSIFNFDSFINVKQFPWSDVNTTALFYCGNTMRQFNPYEVGGVLYYPSLKVDVSFYTNYNSSFPVTSEEIFPGTSVTKSLIDDGNYGLLSMVISLSAIWYYDEARTLLVVSPPEELDFTNKYISCRMFFVKSGKFSHQGSTLTNGSCVFNGIYTKDYVLSEGLDYGTFCYAGWDSSDDSIFYDEELNVIVDSNGYCAVPGKISQIYFVDSPLPSSSSSSGSSSSLSSSSCSCSSSSRSSSCSSSSSSESPWWYISGQTCVAAYQPKGAANLADSYANLVNPGTNDAAPGVAPTWAAVDGWHGDGLATYLTTGLSPNSGNWSMFVRFSSGSGTDSRSVAGLVRSALNIRFYLRPRNISTDTHLYGWGTSPTLTVSPRLAAGVMGLAGGESYLNGSPDGTLGGPWVALSGQSIYLLAYERDGSIPDNFWNGTIQAVAIYSTTLTIADAAALSAAMAAL